MNEAEPNPLTVEREVPMALVVEELVVLLHLLQLVMDFRKEFIPVQQLVVHDR